MPVTLQARSGAAKIIRRDESPDGTAIWLVCEEAEGPPTTIVVAPEDEWFPMGLDATEDDTPVLIVDTTDLNGRFRFRLRDFAAQAAAAAGQGIGEVRLTEAVAKDWGLIKDQP